MRRSILLLGGLALLCLANVVRSEVSIDVNDVVIHAVVVINSVDVVVILTVVGVVFALVVINAVDVVTRGVVFAVVVMHDVGCVVGRKMVVQTFSNFTCTYRIFLIIN